MKGNPMSVGKYHINAQGQTVNQYGIVMEPDEKEHQRRVKAKPHNHRIPPVKLKEKK
jgi:hypothetical protein